MKLKKYSKYKDSQIPWIGEIPEGWEVRRLKINFKYKKGKIPKELFEEKISDNYYPYLSMEYLRGKEENILFTSGKDGGIKVNNKDLLLLWDGSNAGEFVIGKEGFLSSTMVKFELKDINKNYSYYLTSSFESVLRDLTIGMGIPHVNGYDLDNIKIPFVNIPTQQKISKFLGSKTQQIEKLIEKDKKLIELLKEKRVSLINKSVTKGLDDGVKMKDSGIEWIGEIPEEWEVRKLKNITKKIIDGAHFTPTYVEYGIPFLRVTDIQTNKINLDEIKYIPESEHKELIARCNPQKGDLLLSKNGTIGIPKVIDWDYKFSIFVSLCLIKVAGILNVYYLKYFFLSQTIKEQINFFSKTTSVTNLHLDKINEFDITLPPLPTQQKIVDFLDRETAKIDEHIKKIEKRIELYKEYKKSLIYHVVTGKVEV